MNFKFSAFVSKARENPPTVIPGFPSNSLGTSDRIMQGRFLRLIPQYIEQAWFEGTSDPNPGHLFFISIFFYISKQSGTPWKHRPQGQVKR